MNLLLAYDKSIISNRKEQLLKKIKTLKILNSKSESHLSSKIIETNNEHFTSYFLSPNLQIIHLLLTIKKYVKKIELIEKTLSLNPKQLNSYLHKLEQMKLIKYKDGHYSVLESNLHLPNNSPIYKSYISMMKLKAMEQFQKSDTEESYSLNVLFSCSKETRDKIQKKLSNFFKQDTRTGREG